MPTPARISPFAATAASLPPRHTSVATLPALDDIQRDLDELLMLWDCARASGEDITRNRLIFIPDHDPVPRKDDGGIDLAQVTKITILEITDYH